MVRQLFLLDNCLRLEVKIIMKIISAKEINDLYKKVGISYQDDRQINNKLNTGTLNNKLCGMRSLRGSRYSMSASSKLPTKKTTY